MIRRNISNSINSTYSYLINYIFDEGYEYEDPNRKGVKRLEVFSVPLLHKEETYPIISSRKVPFKGAVGELLCFLKGYTDVREFWKYGVHFWDEDVMRRNKVDKEKWAIYKELGVGDSHLFQMGPTYPEQIHLQLDIFDKFKETPTRTDLVISSWNVAELPLMLPKPCHYAFQLIGSNEGFLIKWTQRSTDLILGTPQNVQFYYLLGLILEHWSGYTFKGVLGELSKVHLYDNGMELAEEISNIKIEEDEDLGYIEIDLPDDTDKPFEEYIEGVFPEMFKLIGYSPVLNKSIKMLTYSEKNLK